MIFDWFQHKQLYYEDVLQKLSKEKIRYILIGGIAVSLHGAVRLTVDMDIILDLSEDNIKNFISAMNELGYSPKVPVNPMDFADPEKRKIWINEKNMKVFSFYHSDKPYDIMDVFVANPISYAELDKEKVIKKLRGMEIPVPSLKHLIELKKLAGRDQDRLDVKTLEEIEKLK
jgi:hypothetical protein